VTPKHVGTL